MALNSIVELVRDFFTAGVAHKPDKQDFREWGSYLESFGYKSRAAFAAASIAAAHTSVLITGYYTEGDGGAQQYLRLASAPSTVEAWHVQTADGSWWVPNIEDAYIEQFGAKPESVSSGFNCQPAITAAFKYVGTGGVVRARSTLYNITSTVVQNYEGVAFIGDNSSQYVFGGKLAQGTIIRWMGATGGTVWIMGDLTSTGSLSGPLLDKVTIWGNSTAKTILLNRNVDNAGIGEVKLIYPDPTDSAAFAYYCDSAAASTGGLSGCNFRTHITRLTLNVLGVANGARFTGKAATGGAGVTFMYGGDMRCSYQFGTAYQFHKGDSWFFGSITGSRAGGNADGTANAGAPATGDFMHFGGSGDSLSWFIGNRFGLVRSGKTDGADPIIRFKDVRTFANDLGFLSETDNGCQIVLEGGALEPCYHKGGQGYTATLAALAAYEVADPHKIRGYETTNKDIMNVYDNVQKTNFTPTLKINGSSAGITQTTTGRWQRVGNRVTIWIKFTLTAKSGTGNVTIDWALGAGAPPACDALCETYSAVRPITGFTTGIADRPIGVALVSNTLALLKQIAGGGGMSNLTDADIAATASGVMQLDYYCATAA